MEKINFSLKFMTENFKKLLADKKQFIFECVRLGLIFFYFIWLFIPYFTLRTTAGALVAHFEIFDHNGVLAFSMTLAWVLFFLFFAVAPLVGFHQNRMMLLYIIGIIEVLYWALSLLSYWANLKQLNDLAIPGFELGINVGFWFILLHIFFVAFLALKPKILE